LVVKRNQEGAEGSRHDRDYTESAEQCHPIDDERIKSHLDRVVRGSVEETLNAPLDAEADRSCAVTNFREKPGIPKGQVP